jgi:hypothetical protein
MFHVAQRNVIEGLDTRTYISEVWPVIYHELSMACSYPHITPPPDVPDFFVQHQL